MHTWDRAAEGTRASAAAPLAGATSAASLRMPFEAPKVPLQASPRLGGPLVAQPSVLERTVAHLQLRARDPLAAAGMSAGGRVVALPGEKADAGSGGAAEAEHEDAGAGTAEHESHEGGGREQASFGAAPLAPGGAQAPLQMACASDCGCAKCSAGKKANLLLDLGVQREARPGAGPPVVDGGEVRSRLGAGVPLPGPVLQRFSNAYGRDLSSVRVHANHTLADQLGARAFTVGRDVAFAPGEYRPGTSEGDRLIGHELAHVVQQSGGEGTVQGAGLSEDAYEKEADHAADSAMSGHRVSRFSAVGRPAGQAAVQKAEKGFFDKVGEGLSKAGGAIADTGKAAYRGGKAVVGAAVDTGKAVVGAAVDAAKEGVLAAIRLASPALADFLEDPLGYLESRLVPAITSWVQGLFGVDLGEVAEEAKTAFQELTGTISGALAGDEKACLAFASAVQKVRDVYDRIKNNAVIKKIASALSTLRSGFDKLSRAVLSPVFDVLRKVAGGVWSVVETIGKSIGKAIDWAKEKVAGAVDFISKKLGFGDSAGLLDYLRGKAKEIWEKIQKKLEPVATPLKVMVGIFLIMNPATWTYLIFKYGPAVMEAAKWLWAHRNDPDIVKSARAANHGTLAKILSTVQNIGTAITGAAAKAAGALESGVTAALGFAGAVTGLPILSVTKGIADKIVKGLKGLATTVGGALRKAGAFVSKVAAMVAEKVRPIMHILTKIGMALVNPSSIPVMLAGWAWLKLPDCYKGPIIDLILDALIGILESSPSNPVFGPLWALLKPGIVGFVKQLRKMSTAIKVEASNKIATFMSAGSPQFLLGYVKGLLSGIWDNTAGTIGDIIELGHMLQSLAEGAVASAFSAAMGTPAAPKPAAAPAAAGAAAAPQGEPGGETLRAVRRAPVTGELHRGAATGEIRRSASSTGSQGASPQPSSPQGASSKSAGPEGASPQGASPEGASPEGAGPAAAAAPAPAAVPEPPAPKLDVAGVTEKEITREELDQYRPKDEQEGAPPPVSHEQFAEESNKLAKELKPSASTVVANASGALKEYFKSGSSMTYDQLVAKLGEAWGQAQNLISAQGAKMAREAVAVLLGKDGDFVVGQKVGWIAGMVIVEVVTDVLTGGGAAAAKQAANAAKAAKAVSKPAKWTTRALHAITDAFKTVGKFLMEVPKKLGKLAEQAKGAMTKVVDAIRDAGKSIVAFVERLLGRAGKVHVPTPHHVPVPTGVGSAAAKAESKAAAAEKALAAETKAAKAESKAASAESKAASAESKATAAESKAASTESKAASTESKAASQEGKAASQEGKAASQEGKAASQESKAAREERVKESGNKAEPSPREIDDELDHIGDNQHLITGEPPERKFKLGEHEWREGPDGKWCRFSNTPTTCAIEIPNVKKATPIPDNATDIRAQLDQLKARSNPQQWERKRIKELELELERHFEVPKGGGEPLAFKQKPGESLRDYQKRMESMGREVEERALGATAGDPKLYELYERKLQDVQKQMAQLPDAEKRLAAADQAYREADAAYRRLRDARIKAGKGTAGITKEEHAARSLTEKLAAERKLAKAEVDGLNRVGGPQWKEHMWGDMGNHGKLPCFAPGTLVKTPQGDRPIETLNEGDIVYAFDFERGEVAPRRVLRRHSNWTEHLVRVSVGGDILAATRRHPFWVEERRSWVDARDLRSGDVLRGLGAPVSVGSVELVGAVSPTFNLEVEGLHCFFVGRIGVLVHNGGADSVFGKPDLHDTKFYRIIGPLPDGGTGVVYVGKTWQETIEARFSKHMADKGWTSPPYKPQAIDCPVKRQMTAYETAVWEKHYIEQYKLENKAKGISFEHNGGEPLWNDPKADPINAESYKQHRGHPFNRPCD